MDQFLTVENFKVCKAVLQVYMQDKYGFDVSARVPTDALNPLLYKVMREVQETYRDSVRDVKDANNIALNMVKDRLLKQFASGSAGAGSAGNVKPVQMQSLERDASVFGNRPMSDSMQIRSEPVTSLRDDSAKDVLMQTYEALMQQRKPASEPTPVPPSGATSQRVDPMPSTEFAKKITELERSRDDVFKAAQDTQRPTIADDPAALYRSTAAGPSAALADDRLPPSKASSGIISQQKKPPEMPLRDYIDFNQESQIPFQQALHKKLEITRYITLNAAERQWALDPMRYRFSAAYLNALVQYRNVTCIEFTRLIIPLEIKENASITNIPKPHYQHRLDFAYPYLLLSIPELDNVYAGQVKAQAAFVYDTNYCSINGRGYLVLSPMQKEKLEFWTTPLASLPRLTVSILKPNGQLFNQSKDQHTLQMVAYEAFNSTYLKIVLTRYHDKNEFYQGDTIFIRDYVMTPPTVGGTVSNGYYQQMMQFINRPEGHEILEIGQPNEFGFYRNFSIQAPGAFDNTIGKYVQDAATIEALSEYNTSCGLLSENFQNGRVLNASLQPIVSMKITTVAGDAASVLNVQTV